MHTTKEENKMLLVVDQSLNEVLFRVDAWQADCMEQADKFINDNGYLFMKQEITVTGNMVLWVI